MTVLIRSWARALSNEKTTPLEPPLQIAAGSALTRPILPVKSCENTSNHPVFADPIGNAVLRYRFGPCRHWLVSIAVRIQMGSGRRACQLFPDIGLLSDIRHGRRQRKPFRRAIRFVVGELATLREPQRDARDGIDFPCSKACRRIKPFAPNAHAWGQIMLQHARIVAFIGWIKPGDVEAFG